jgi:hypothetical protein
MLYVTNDRPFPFWTNFGIRRIQFTAGKSVIDLAEL